MAGRKSGKTSKAKIGVGVIGLGMGRGHANAARSHEHTQLVAVCDLSELRLKEMGDQLGVDTEDRYTDYRKMLERKDIDLVVVATPNKFHAPLSIDALHAGKAVYVEKPMASSAVESARMCKAARATRQRLAVGFNFRFSGPSFAVKRAIEAGLLGDTYFCRTAWTRRRGIPLADSFCNRAISGGGGLIDLGVHRLDLAMWFLGHPQPLAVSGTTFSKFGDAHTMSRVKTYDVDDFATAIIRLEGGKCIHLEAGWAMHQAENERMYTQVFGTTGSANQHNINGGYDFTADFVRDENGSQVQVQFDRTLDPVPNIIAHMADCMLADKPHWPTGEEGHKVQLILDAIYKSAEKGREVILKPAK